MSAGIKNPMGSCLASRPLVLINAVILGLLLSADVARGQTYDVVHSFTGINEGSLPNGLIQASDGNFYGTARIGGVPSATTNNTPNGTVFKMDAAGTVTTLHSFSVTDTFTQIDGATPRGGLVQGRDGNFYGTTLTAGASNGAGTVFKIDASGAYSTLHVFTITDGSNPVAGLIQATDGAFYGTTPSGGVGLTAQGTVFKVTASGVFTLLHTFLVNQGVPGNQGYAPLAGVIQASDGNFYGTTSKGGANGYGTVFKMTPGGTVTVLHSFIQTGAAPEGSHAPVLQAADGNLYGTTFHGGANGTGMGGYGTVFRIDTNGSTYVTLHSFAGGTAGMNPETPLIQARDGNFYGTTSSAQGVGGTVFRMDAAGHVTTLKVFAVPDAFPSAVIQAADGRLYGTTLIGGSVPLVAGLAFRLAIPPTTTITRDGDFDGDGKTDLTVYRPSTGTWFTLRSSTSFTTSGASQFGVSGDVPVPGDYDGDGKTDVAVYRPGSGTWFTVGSTSGSSSIQFGLAGDLPAPGDYDGDGKTDLAVYRPGAGTWFIRQSSTATVVTYLMGLKGDIPAPADYDGDKKTDATVFRPSTGTWYIRQSSTSTIVNYQWGLRGDVPVPGDYDGDSKADVAVYRPASGTWYILQSTTGYATSVSYQWGSPGDIPVAADYDGDGTIDLAVFRPANGTWYIRQSTTAYAASVSYQWGSPGDIATPGSPILNAFAAVSGRALANLTAFDDFDGDGKADITVFRPSSGTWFSLRSGANFTTSANISFGVNGDVPVTGDYDGDGKTDIAVYRPGGGTWYILRSSDSSMVTAQWGIASDVAVPGDYDGDGKTDVAVYRPGSGNWFILQSSNSTSTTYPWGVSTDVPVPGDYDSDGKTDLAVWRPSTGQWFIKYSSTNYSTSATFQWGSSTDITVPGDYDGDGKTDLGVFRPSTGVWYISLSGTSYVTSVSFQWGLGIDVPVAGDFDGDGKTDLAVFRPSSGAWFILKSSTGFTSSASYLWGLTGDIPILRRP